MKYARKEVVRCYTCLEPLFENEVFITDSNLPCGVIKKHQNYIKYGESRYYCEKCAGVVDVVCN